MGSVTCFWHYRHDTEQTHVFIIDAVCVANGDGNYFNTDECKGGYTCSGNFISRTVTCTAGTYYSTQFGLCLSLVPANCVGGKYICWEFF